MGSFQAKTTRDNGLSCFVSVLYAAASHLVQIQFLLELHFGIHRLDISHGRFCSTVSSSDRPGHTDSATYQQSASSNSHRKSLRLTHVSQSQRWRLPGAFPVEIWFGIGQLYRRSFTFRQQLRCSRRNERRRPQRDYYYRRQSYTSSFDSSLSTVSNSWSLPGTCCPSRCSATDVRLSE